MSVGLLQILVLLIPWNTVFPYFLRISEVFCLFRFVSLSKEFG
jgi:hypothetical protein